MTFFNKRLDLSQREYDCLKSCIDFKKLEEFVNKENDYLDEYKVLNKLINKLNNPKIIEYSFKKHTASEKATRVRTEKAKKKIQIAIEILKTQKKKITHYSIAQVCGVSFTTVKKYLDDDTLKSLNEVELLNI